MTQAQTDFIVNHIIDQLTLFLTQDFSLSIPDALNIIYNSETYRLVKEKENGLYIQSPSYIYELLKREYQKASIKAFE